MYSFLLQNWVTIQGTTTAPGTPFTQSENAWLDTSAFLDLVTFLEVDQQSSTLGTIAMGFQTAPTKDDLLFQNMNDTTVTLTTGVTVGVLLRDTAFCPLSHWLRWQIIPNVPGPASFSATFRIWVAANAPGGFARSEAVKRDRGEETGAGPSWVFAPTPPTSTTLNTSTVSNVHPKKL